MSQLPSKSVLLSREIEALLAMVNELLKKLAWDLDYVPEHNGGSERFQLVFKAYNTLSKARERSDAASIECWQRTALENGFDGEHLMKCLREIIQDLEKRNEGLSATADAQ